MAVLHVYRDSLWSYGGRKAPNDGFRADEIVAAEALKREESRFDEVQEELWQKTLQEEKAVGVQIWANVAKDREAWQRLEEAFIEFCTT